MGLSDLVSKLIVEHGSATVMAQHRDFYKDQLLLVREQALKLEAENDNLIQENDQLKKQIAANTVSSEWLDHAGASFKKLSTGGYSVEPYCPICHSILSSPKPHPRVPYTCANKSCGYETYFSNGIPHP